jgi:hypothetical protein
MCLGCIVMSSPANAKLVDPVAFVSDVCLVSSPANAKLVDPVSPDRI